MEEVVRFQADVAKFSFDTKGNFILTLVVSPEHKWAALPLTDIRGRRFTAAFYTVPNRARKLREKMAAAPIPTSPRALRP